MWRPVFTVEYSARPINEISAALPAELIFFGNLCRVRRTQRTGNPSPYTTVTFDVRMRGFRERAEVADVLRLLEQPARPLPSETVGLTGAAGQVFAADVVADVAVPPFDRAAKDGYALRGGDTFGAAP